MIKNNNKNSGNTKEIVVIGSLNADDSFIKRAACSRSHTPSCSTDR